VRRSGAGRIKPQPSGDGTRPARRSSSHAIAPGTALRQHEAVPTRHHREPETHQRRANGHAGRLAVGNVPRRCARPAALGQPPQRSPLTRAQDEITPVVSKHRLILSASLVARTFSRESSLRPPLATRSLPPSLSCSAPQAGPCPSLPCTLVSGLSEGHRSISPPAFAGRRRTEPYACTSEPGRRFGPLRRILAGMVLAQRRRQLEERLDSVLDPGFRLSACPAPWVRPVVGARLSTAPVPPSAVPRQAPHVTVHEAVSAARGVTSEPLCF
jgi:hypothetical protein